MQRIHRSPIKRQQDRWGFLFAVPALSFFSVFSFYPIANALFTSFTNKQALSLNRPKFVGLANYTYLLSSADFWNSMRATAVFTAGTFAALVVVSLLLSAFISGLRRGKTFFQMAYYSPAVLSSVVAATIWLLIFDPRGLANQAANLLLATPGVDHDWFINPFMEQLSTMFVYFWKYIGYFVIICMAGMAGIPPSIYEAVRIDGGSHWQTYWRITFPLLRPTVLLVSIMSMLQCLKTFSVQYLFTLGGAPLRPINVITLNIYHTGIQYYRTGRATAMSIILLVIMVVLTWVQFRGSRSEEVTY
jgi:multiple sugar transport system permease protein